jgi:tetratricopeptide (TPR) repeat protein
MDRIDEFKQFIASRPDDPMPRYALGMEYKNRGQHDEAIQTFKDLVALKPDFAAGYQQCGMLLAKLGRAEEAKTLYRNGIEAAARSKNWHAKSEMEGFLDELE